MPINHLPVALRTEDFERWLFFWQANCRAQLPRDVAKEMIDLADHISHRLRMILGLHLTILWELGSRSRYGRNNITRIEIQSQR
jgi:hypothetical protein